MITLAAALLIQIVSTAVEPPRACFAIVADAEGEMALAEDAEWRAKAAARTRALRATTQSRAQAITAELAEIRTARATLYADYRRGGMDEEDFTSARSELEMRARTLIEERDTPLLKACGV